VFREHPALRLDNLTKHYDDGTVALENFELEIPAGAFFGLLAGRVVGLEGSGNTATTRAGEETLLDPDHSLEGLVLGCNLAVRRDVIAAVRGRDTRLGPGRGLAYEDIDFVYRVLRQGIRGCFSPRPVVVHRLGERNRRVEYLRGRGAYYAKFIVRLDRTIARYAWWDLNVLWLDFRRGVVRPTGSPATRAWHMAVGAALMTARMLVSAVGLGAGRR
jgi:GT2 family glycosyltransferase